VEGRTIDRLRASFDAPVKAAVGALTLVAVALTVPAQAAWPEGRVRSLAEIRHAGVVMQQWDLSCGAAALATLLTFDLGDPVSERRVAAAMLRRAGAARVQGRGGFSLLDMQEFAEARGYQADGFGEMTLDDLSSRLPAIVPVDFHGYEHFVVVRQLRDGQVLLADPAYGQRTLAVPAFDRAWQSRIAFVVAPR
jgi:uncharacterized protein